MRTSKLIFVLMILFFSCKTTKNVPSTPVPAPVITLEPPKIDTVFLIPDTIKPKLSIMRPGKTDGLLEDLLKSRPEYFRNILDNRDSLRVQIIYTKIDRQADNSPVFSTYLFNVNEENYFYPASTVKMPVAAMALQRLNELRVFGLNSNSSLITESSYKSQSPVYNDPTTPDGRPSIAQYIKKIFLVSDNDAFNRLYEFLGQQYINERLHSMGYPKADILHRLNIPLSEDENRHTNAVRFFSETGKMLYTQPMQVSELAYPRRNDSIGRGYVSGNTTINEPMSFSAKNKIGLEDLTSMLKSIMFPEAVSQKQKFNLRTEDYHFLYKQMSQYPGESRFPFYDSSSYPDAYQKFLLHGSQQDTLPKHIRIFNKAGDAFGFLTDVAYIADFDENIEFMLSATIYCNSNGILNDDKYDYQTIGLPFMKELGKLLYDYELKRERLQQPDLSGLKLRYDK